MLCHPHKLVYHPYLGLVIVRRVVGNDVLVEYGTGFRFWTERHCLREMGEK